jgi:hypothetical protein
MTRHISVNVGGLWRTEVELKERATWWNLKNEIEKVTGIQTKNQILTPTCKDDFTFCELEEGEEVFCDWKLHDGDHPLHCAAEYGNIEAIRSWLASGADVNVINDNGQTPLMYACLNLNEESMNELLKLGANINCVDTYGNTLLHSISFWDYMCCYRWGTHDEVERRIENAKKIAKTLIALGLDPTTQNNNGETFVNHVHNDDFYIGVEFKKILEEWDATRI